MSKCNKVFVFCICIAYLFNHANHRIIVSRDKHSILPRTFFCQSSTVRRFMHIQSLIIIDIINLNFKF
jgi:uncharacterized membrane protein